MKTLKTVAPEMPLRVGLSLTFLWSGYDLINNPQNWTWAINSALESSPKIFFDIISEIEVNQLLQAQGIVEIIFAVLLISWFVPHRIIRFVSLLLAFELFLIILLVGINTVTFRDMGLIGGALSVFLISNKKSK